MDILREYALLIAVSLPLVVIAAMQAWLFFVMGERHTLLLPTPGAYPEVETAPAASTPPVIPARVAESVAATPRELLEEAA
jgi:hypothetical protein